MEALVHLINKLPAWFLMVVIIAVLVWAVFILPKVRRDKNGKLYVFSRKYEASQTKQKEILKLLDTMVEKVDEVSAWSQRTILFSENFSVGERLAAGSRLEQLSDGWRKTDHCYNGEARSEYERLQNLEGRINRNEYCIDMLRPIVKNYGDRLERTHERRSS
jgi:hypothetical protein